jgi:GNAT superfamily N-acetyltransferase
MLVAEDEQGIVGYVVSDRSFFERGFVHLLFVSGRHRRRGIGAALLAEAVRSCAPVRVFTSTNQSNATMQALLDAQGWVRAGSVDGLDEGDPELFFYVDPDRLRVA